MATLAQIYDWFMTGKKPTQAQFWASWGSFWNKSETIPQSAISNLATVLNAKTENDQFNAHKVAEDAHSAEFGAKADAADLTSHLTDANAHSELFEAFGNPEGKEDIENKQNDLTPDASNLKYPTVTAVIEALATLSPDFTTQEILTGGNYNNLEVTADLVVFKNENAQAILNGVWGKKEFHILNLSSLYEVRINHNSSSIVGNGQPIMLPTASGNMGVKGTARILETDGYGYFVADTWGSKYRPEFKNLPSTQVVVVDANSNADTKEIIELIVFRDAQTTAMSRADLNTEYPTALRGLHVVCNQINTMYIKTDGNNSNWKSIILTAVS